MTGPVARRFGHGAAHLLVGGPAYWPERPAARGFGRDVATALCVGLLFVFALSPLLRRDDARTTRIAMLEPPRPEARIEPKIERAPEPVPPPPPLAKPAPPPRPPKPVAKPEPPKVAPPPRPAAPKPTPRPRPELARVPLPPPSIAPAPAPAPPPEPVRTARLEAPRTEPQRARVPIPVPAAIDAAPASDPAPAALPARATRTREPAAPTAAAPSARRRSSDGVRGVALGELRACHTDREEDALKQRVLGVAPGPGECSSAAGWYRLVEAKNLNSFLMWIERAAGRTEADRCDELRHALACFAGMARAGGRR